MNDLNVTKSGKKPYLLSYKMIEDLKDFFLHIYEASKKYEYISATERRCFNLVSYYLPNLQNLISNNGLLLQYKDLAYKYVENHKFPRILIVDDIMIHGRGMSKFLDQLECLLYFELEQYGLFTSLDGRQEFSHEFRKAIDIYIYAQNADSVLLEERFVQNITCMKHLHGRELRDLSLQLSDSLARWGIANTSFVYSVRCEKLTRKLALLENWEITNTNDWVRIPWIYDKEHMVLFVRFHGENNVNRVSTIRFFPNRMSMVPQITSFTILGDLKQSVLDEICNEIFQILQSSTVLDNELSDNYKALYNILKPNNMSVNELSSIQILSQSKAQLISFFVSVIDLLDFCKTICPDYLLNKFIEDKTDDLGKISRNFGLNKIMFPPLNDIVVSLAKHTELLNQFKNAIYPVLSDIATPVLPGQPQRYMDSFIKDEINEDYCSKVNDTVANIFYKVGRNAEVSAVSHRKRPYLFRPSEYQKYTYSLGDYGKDGVIAFLNFWNIISKKMQQPIRCKAFEYLAAYIAIMDHGVMSVRFCNVNDSDNQSKLITLAKAGEMATFYVPRQLSMFIPAFSIIEDLYFLVARSPDEAISNFFNERNQKELTELFDNEKDIQRWLIEVKPHIPTLNQLKKYMTFIYDCHQSFSGWNFKNLTYQSGDIQRKYQWFLKKKALIFLNLPAD